MTRDTYDLFTQHDRRRRAGDDEARKSDLVDLDLDYAGHSPKAIAVKREGEREWIWLPLSQCEYEMTAPGRLRLTLPKWLARQKGLLA